MAPTLTTPRLTLRSWRVDDAPAALEIYGNSDVARWLSPAMDRVTELDAMRQILRDWIAQDVHATLPAGRWAIERRSDGRIVGGVVLLPLPPRGDDLEIGWQLIPEVWGNGYATEANHGVAGWAFTQGLDEVFAVVRPGNTRAAAVAVRNGMEWVGETDKYFGLTLQVYRLRPDDLARSRVHVTLAHSSGPGPV
jgi:RimJ/RimL family protein N-acetyltransferase